jgi:Cellulase (glycosyl hydrolase family 5)
MRKTLILFSTVYLFFGCAKQQAEVSPQATTDTKPATTKTTLAVGAASIAGVNWADGRDNFVDGWVIPSGLTASDDYNTVSAKANAILSGFQTNMSGVNTVRLPINPPSVSQSWWGAYTGAIDKALSKGMKVILCCWESSSARDGKIDDINAFWTMWQTVVNKYGSNGNVYFEVFNEPYGYSLSDLTSIYAQWLSRYPSVAKGRIILSGTGYSENVTGVGADSRFTSCLLALHNYAYWATRSTSGWESDWRSRFGSYGARTVVTEFGATMNSHKDYQNGSQADNEIAYIVASSNVFRNDKVASVYWPGLRDNDSYSIQTRGGSGTNITLTTVNSSGVFRVRYGWGLN